MKKEKQTKKRSTLRRWIKWSILAVVLVYAGLAILPFAFPPESDPAIISAMAEGPAEAAEGQRAAILETGEEGLWGRLYLIDHAESSLRMTSYLYACDESGQRIGAALLRAADRGVKVQILVDGLIGGIQFTGRVLPHALGTHENIEIRYYNPLRLWDPMGLNVRLHEKYLIADESCMIMGGRNISNEFLTPEGHPMYNDDRDVMLFADVPGPNTGVGQLSQYFNALWASRWTAPRYDTGGNQQKIEQERQLMAALLAETERDKESWYAKMEAPDFTVPVEKAVLLHNPSHIRVKEPWALDALCALMAEGEEQVRLQSPYFVLDGHMKEQLEKIAAAPSAFDLYTNSMASGNNIMASSDYVLQKGRVTAVDGTLYESQLPYSSHTKSMLVDENLSIFGSFNFDMRSAYIDTEVMMAVYSEPLNARLAEKMDRVESVSLEVTKDGYAPSENVVPMEMGFGKTAIIYGLSPILFLIRFLL